MQAILQTAYGGSDSLVLGHAPVPLHPGDEEVLLRVHAAGVDRAVWHFLTGTPYLLRLAFGLWKPRNAIPGLDLSGRVVAIGRRVTHLGVGDEVFGLGIGAYAEYARAQAEQVALRPRRVDAVAASICAMSGVTALQALRKAGRAVAGQKVLIMGASGGVGAYAVQIAKHDGAEVSALCSTAKADFVRGLGADHVFDYADFDVGTHAQRYQTIIDIAGNRPLAQLRRLLTERGTLVIVGGEHGGPWTAGLGRQLAAWLLNPFVRQRLVPLVSIVGQEDLQTLAELIDGGGVRPPLDQVFPLAEAAQAIDHLAQGRVRGKIAIVVTPQA